MMQESQMMQDKVRPRNPLTAWFDVRRHRLGSWAFAINRLTALGLTLYLFVHLAVLTILLQGESAWDDFVELAKTPFFLVLDVVLLFGLLFHGLNGIRVALVGMGIGEYSQKRLFWILILVGTILLLAGGYLIFAAEG